MKCGKCEFARIDLEDDEDVYYCKFDNKFAFHSGEECHHPCERQKILSHRKGAIRGRKMIILDYIFCFIIKRLPPCKLERWMIRQLVTWIRR